MPEDLLDELEPAAPVVGNLANIEDLLRVVVRDVGMAVQGMRGSARAFEKAWQRIVLAVARGQTSQIHATRPRLARALEQRINQLKHTHTLATFLAQLGKPAVPDPDVVLSEIASAERLKARVFDRWQSAEDLEDLAARDYPLTSAELDRIGPQRRPPAAYYADESKPF